MGLIVVLIMLTGYICNRIVIVANGGMPVPYWHYMASPNPNNVPMTLTTRFVPLADIISIQQSYHGICFSIGDLLMILGFLISAVYMVRLQLLRRTHGELNEIL
jgi:hypothetical protein